MILKLFYQSEVLSEARLGRSGTWQQLAGRVLGHPEQRTGTGPAGLQFHPGPTRQHVGRQQAAHHYQDTVGQLLIRPSEPEPGRGPHL